jgi:hypothetical protein
MRKEMKTANLLPKTKNGSIQLVWKRCGRKTCRCTSGLLHGPYMAFCWREAGTQKKRYVCMRNLAIAVLELQEQRAARHQMNHMKLALREAEL